MCYNWGMDPNTPLTPLPDKKAKVAHEWLLKEQMRLAEKVGEPLFVTIHLVFDGTIEVDVKTFAGKQGMAGGESLPESLTAAVETLLYLHEIEGGLFIRVTHSSFLFYTARAGILFFPKALRPFSKHVLIHPK